MAHYYLVAGLPELRFGERPGLSMAEFRETCAVFLSEGERRTLFRLLEGELDSEALEPAGAWADMEIQIRNAGARALARKAGVEPARYERTYGRYYAEAEEAVSAALGEGNPLERESRLDRGRRRLAEELALGDPFGFGAVVSYGIRLAIAWRWAEMDKETGGQKVREFLESALSERAGGPA
jgi:hypothetical protein